jgi:hypothetical protein
MQPRFLALVAIFLLGFTGVAQATPTAPAVTLKPSRAALVYGKLHVPGFARRSSRWWHRYLTGGPYPYTGCKPLAAHGVTGYGCFLENRVGGVELALVAFIRFSRCKYGYEIQAAQGAPHSVQGAFTYCG